VMEYGAKRDLSRQFLGAASPGAYGSPFSASAAELRPTLSAHVRF
jgi:hypothetical protein